MAWVDSVPSKTLWRLFSPATLKRLAAYEQPGELRRLLASDSSIRIPSSLRVLDIYEDAYRHLCEVRPAEYFYKTALVQRNILGRGGSRKARIFFEFRAGKSKLDSLVISGDSMHALEIKTELDQFRRLPTQIADYQSRFSHVWVYSSEKQALQLRDSLREEVGIAFLSRSSRFEVVREPQRYTARLDPRLILESLQRFEYLAVLRLFGFEGGDLPNTRVFSEAMRFASTLDAESVHEATMRQLKDRPQASSISSIAQLPLWLRAGALAARCDESEVEALLRVLRRKVGKEIK